MKKSKVNLTDTFWSGYRHLVRTEMIPYQWQILNDAIDITIEKERNDSSIPNEKSHAIKNFQIAAGIKEGSHYGWVFQDSDVYKWLEAVAYSLCEREDENLKKLADGVVDLISKAQEEDGYLNTYFTIEAPERRFKRLGESHELYCAGHFMEAAVAYYEATRNQLVLKVARRLADCIDRNFGEEEGKIHGCDGHEEIEIGLMRLYHLTNEERYLRLSRYFLLVRGKDKDFFRKQNCSDRDKSPLIVGMEQFPDSYYQVHYPVTLQDTAEGHAVRLVYMCTAMADVAATTKDQVFLNACKRIWRNIVDKRLYITGGIGSTVIGESFTLDYDLPNDTMYCETCASIGLIFFARQMLRNESKGEYGDIMERALYNTVLSGMALDGKHFFYVNPLEVVPRKSKKDPGKSHVKCVRPQWLGCACCPPNLARLITSIENYIYTEKENVLLVNLYMDSDAEFQIGNSTLMIVQKTNYPREGQIVIQCKSNCTKEVTIGLRVPAWCEKASVFINGTEQVIESEDGFWYITSYFNDDEIVLNLELNIQRWYANTKVSEDIGKVAIARGPMVYCLEGVDNGEDLHCLSLSPEVEFEYLWKEKELGGIGIITAEGTRLDTQDGKLPLYSNIHRKSNEIEQKLTWIPYYTWANRGETEMSVWVREK